MKTSPCLASRPQEPGSNSGATRPPGEGHRTPQRSQTSQRPNQTRHPGDQHRTSDKTKTRKRKQRKNPRTKERETTRKTQKAFHWGLHQIPAIQQGSNSPRPCGWKSQPLHSGTCPRARTCDLCSGPFGDHTTVNSSWHRSLAAVRRRG